MHTSTLTQWYYVINPLTVLIKKGELWVEFLIKVSIEYKMLALDVIQKTIGGAVCNIRE